MAGAVNGVAVGLAGVGGLLLWSGIRNVTWADSLRELLKLPNQSTPISTPFGDVASGLASYVAPDVDGGNAASTAAGNASAAGLVGKARSQIGKPYAWAAVGPTAFDCSGLVLWALTVAGRLPGF